MLGSDKHFHVHSTFYTMTVAQNVKLIWELFSFKKLGNHQTYEFILYDARNSVCWVMRKDLPVRRDMALKSKYFPVGCQCDGGCSNKICRHNQLRIGVNPLRLCYSQRFEQIRGAAFLLISAQGM